VAPFSVTSDLIVIDSIIYYDTKILR
jgi:hypothetical protein